MKRLAKALKRLEKKVPAIEEPQFISWPANPWTPEQMAEALRREPNRKMFWRALLETPEETARKMADPNATL